MGYNPTQASIVSRPIGMDRISCMGVLGSTPSCSHESWVVSSSFSTLHCCAYWRISHLCVWDSYDYGAYNARRCVLIGRSFEGNGAYRI